MILNKKEVIAKNSSISVGTRKIAAVVRLIQGMPIVRAMDVLSLSHKACAMDIMSLLNSAVKNAVNELSIDDITNLYIKDIRLGRGRKAKRFMPRARGRSNKIVKHSSNLAIVVGIK